MNIVHTQNNQKVKRDIVYTKLMSAAFAKTAVWSNNPDFQALLTKSSFTKSVRFVDYKSTVDCPYLLLLIDLCSDLNDISQKIISIYDSARKARQKLAVVISHGEKIDSEKNLYFSQVLDRLAGEAPLHRLVFVKDLYQENFLQSDTWLEKYLLESLINRKIVISGKGENLYYPLSFQDLVGGLQKIYFLSGTAGKSFWLVGDPFTDLDLAYLLKKNLDDIDDQFEIEATGVNYTELNLNSLGNQTRAILNWEPVDDFTQSLKKAVKRMGEDKTLLLSKLHQKTTAPKHSWGKNFLQRKKGTRKKAIETSRELITRIGEIIFISAAGLYLIITLSFVVFTALGLTSLEKSLTKARAGDITASVRTLESSVSYSKIGEISYTFVSPVLALLAPNFHEKNHNLFVFLDYSQSSLENLQQTYLLAEKVYLSIGNTNENLNYLDISLALESNLSQVYENINQIRLLTQSGKLPELLDRKLQANPEFKNISLVEQQITQLLKTVELMPAFLAGDTAKNIIILFQNSQELRSTGGTVDYVLSVVLDHGRLVSRNLYSAGELDSLILENLFAPPLVNLYTGSEKWHLRDLNYNPDFVSTATNFSVVINKSLNLKPDIILAVNESLLIDFLKEDQGIILNGQNVTDVSFKAELPAVSPSPLYQQLIDFYLDSVLEHKLSLITLGRVLTRQSLTGQLLFWTADEVLENSIVHQSFSGAIFTHSCHSAIPGGLPCHSETTYLNESNFSLVPVGSDLKRKITHQVSLLPSGTRHKYIVDYVFIREFTGLNRDLSSIIQLYAPEGSYLDQVTVNGKTISSKSILSQKENLLERFQIPVSLLFNQDNRLEISFFSPSGKSLQIPFAYSLTEYRQPGLTAGESDVELSLEIPPSSRASLITAPAVSAPGGFNFVYPDKTATFGLVLEPK